MIINNIFYVKKVTSTCVEYQMLIYQFIQNKSIFIPLHHSAFTVIKTPSKEKNISNLYNFICEYSKIYFNIDIADSNLNVKRLNAILLFKTGVDLANIYKIIHTSLYENMSFHFHDQPITISSILYKSLNVFFISLNQIKHLEIIDELSILPSSFNFYLALEHYKLFDKDLLLHYTL